LVLRLSEITSHQQQTQRTLLDWLRVEHGIEKPSNKLTRAVSVQAEAPKSNFLCAAFGL
jgi:hypothetical protein